MLLKKWNPKEQQSKFLCDMCRKMIINRDRYVIYVGRKSEAHTKKWDLCEDCYKILNKNINTWYARLEYRKIKGDN